MPFTKETAREAGKKGGEGAKAKYSQWENIVGWLIGDGGTKFKDLLMELATGVEITKEQKEFLQHYKDLLEYHQPKLARNVGVQQIDQTVTFKWDDESDNTIQAEGISKASK